MQGQVSQLDLNVTCVVVLQRIYYPSKSILFHFPFGMGTYDYHAKYQGGGVRNCKRTLFFVIHLNLQGTLMKKGSLAAKKTPRIFCVVVIGTHNKGLERLTYLNSKSLTNYPFLPYVRL